MLHHSNLTKNLKELKESCRKQSEELQDLLIQRDKLQEETITNGEHEDTLVNDNGLDKPVASTSKVRDVKKRPKKQAMSRINKTHFLNLKKAD